MDEGQVFYRVIQYKNSVNQEDVAHACFCFSGGSSEHFSSQKRPEHTSEESSDVDGEFKHLSEMQ